MAKSEAEIQERKEKKDKKRKREETATADAEDGVVAKKEKKDKKRKSLEATAAADADGDGDVTMSTPAKVANIGVEEEVVRTQVPRSALVAFAQPLADDKAQKKLLKSIKRAAKNKALKRGVKECVKAIRKSDAGNPAAVVSTSVLPSGIVLLAADISPMDVISHIPVLCEDHNIPYIFMPSRAELGAAGNTKRPTSIVMISSKPGKGQEGVDAEWNDTYKDLHKLAVKLGAPIKA